MSHIVSLCQLLRAAKLTSFRKLNSLKKGLEMS